VCVCVCVYVYIAFHYFHTCVVNGCLRRARVGIYVHLYIHIRTHTATCTYICRLGGKLQTMRINRCIEHTHITHALAYTHTCTQDIHRLWWKTTNDEDQSLYRTYTHTHTHLHIHIHAHKTFAGSGGRLQTMRFNRCIEHTHTHLHIHIHVCVQKAFTDCGRRLQNDGVQSLYRINTYIHTPTHMHAYIYLHTYLHTHTHQHMYRLPRKATNDEDQLLYRK
jgi:hypothetical protein